MELYCSLMLIFGYFCTGYVGDIDVCWPRHTESSLGYHARMSGNLTLTLNLVEGQRLVGSLTGAVASQRVTEAFKGSLRLVGHQP